LLSIEYSAPPLRFKTTPFLDSVSNGLYVLPGVIAFTAIEGSYPPLAAVAGGWLWTMGMHTFSAIPDIEPDRAAGIRTTATVLGKGRTYLYCGLCWAAAAVAFLAVHPFFTAVLVAYPLIVFAIARSGVDVDDAYWWYPAINTVAGMVITMGGLWAMIYGVPF
jgi:4-hydroxybenzoate polyprenyltransferase